MDARPNPVTRGHPSRLPSRWGCTELKSLGPLTQHMHAHIIKRRGTEQSPSRAPIPYSPSRPTVRLFNGDMGSCLSGVTEEHLKSQNVNAEIVQAMAGDQETIKLLLLGAGESGKSTIFKQMQILYSNGFTTEQKKSFLPKIGFNLAEGINTLCNAVIDLGIGTAIEDQHAFDSILNMSVELKPPTREMAGQIQAVWKEPAVKEAWGRRAETQVNDSLLHFINKVACLAQDLPRLSRRETQLTVCHCRRSMRSQLRIQTIYRRRRTFCFAASGQRE